jgi:AraC-like DNA-binding protein/mannose-6-phosphate isomerase-like protein (cupin superfamily)
MDYAKPRGRAISVADSTTVARKPQEFRAFAALPHSAGRLASWLEAVRLRPVSAWQWQCTPEWEQHPRTVPDAMWFCVEQGTGWCRLGDLSSAEKVRVGPGDIFLVPKAVPHHVKPDRGVAFRLYTVHFFADLYGTVDLVAALGMGGVYRPERGAHYVRASNRLAREFALKAPGWSRAMEAAVWDVLLHIVREGSAGPDLQLEDELSRLQPVLDLVDERLADPSLRVADMASVVHVSEVYLRKLFREALGVSPVTFLRLRRVERATLLLRATEWPIKRIARECGFAELPFFFRTFKRLTGRTPKNYREAREP